MYDKILVPMALDHDISPDTLKIAQTLLSKGGEVIALHIYEAAQSSVKSYLDEDIVQKGYQRARETLAQKLEGTSGITPELVVGHTARSIIDYATSHAVGCIVIGSHKPGLSDYFLGSTASRVVRHAPCAVHVHRHS